MFYLMMMVCRAYEKNEGLTNNAVGFGTASLTEAYRSG